MGIFYGLGVFASFANIKGVIFRQKKGKMAVKRLVVNAVLIAIYYALRLLNIPFGDAFRFTLAPFSVILCALLFGPVDGLIVGLLGEFLSQILGPYGLTPTTLLWCLGETVRGVSLGLCSMLFLRKWLMSTVRLKGKKMVVLLVCCVVTGVMASLCQTFALYVDSTLMGYYNYHMVFGVMVWRILVYIVLAVGFGYLSLPIISALRKAKLV